MRGRQNSAYRTARTVLVAVTVWVALVCSACAAPGPAELASIVQARPAHRTFNAFALAAQPLLPGSLLSAHVCGPLALAAPRSASVNPKGRIFVEGTTAPSSEAFKANRLDCVLEASNSPLPTDPVLRNRSITPANRQRAP